MKFIVEIDCDNAAFEGDPMWEVARILKEQATKLERWLGDAEPVLKDTLKDINGNKVGTASFVYNK
jgi:hypothetical protein